MVARRCVDARLCSVDIKLLHLLRRQTILQFFLLPTSSIGSGYHSEPRFLASFAEAARKACAPIKQSADARCGIDNPPLRIHPLRQACTPLLESPSDSGEAADTDVQNELYGEVHPPRKILKAL
jgi:hypothetical protein